MLKKILIHPDGRYAVIDDDDLTGRFRSVYSPVGRFLYSSEGTKELFDDGFIWDTYASPI